MAVTTFSPLLGLALPTTGDLDGTWGTTVNDAITSLLDSAVAGTTTLSADADVTLSTTDGVANQARSAVILWTASNGANTRNISAPNRSKAYILINAGTGSVVIRGITGPTAGITVTAGNKALVAWNGSDFVKITGGPINLASSDVTGTLPIANGGTGTTSTTFVNLATNVTGTLPAANGGTAQSTYSTGDMVYASATNTLSKRTIGSSGQVLTVAAGVPTWSDAVTGLPSQTGNEGKYLTTNGSTASWASTGAAAGGGIYVNNDVISTNYTIASGQNGFSVGPMTISSGYAITVSSGQRWVVI
jgi:hypothetical protein